MNLFDFTYCGNYNRQIQNLARIAPEKWSFRRLRGQRDPERVSGKHLSQTV